MQNYTSRYCLNCPILFEPQKANISRWNELQAWLRDKDQLSPPQKCSQLLEDAEDDLRRCLDVIAHQKMHLAFLQKQCNHLKAHVEGYKTLLAPFRRLPVQILARIFLFVCPNNYVGTRIHQLPGVVLAGVCSQWRRVVLSTPEIWSNISFHAQGDSSIDEDNHWTTALDFLLVRSGVNLIKVELSCEYGQTNYHAMVAALNHLGSHSTRWQSLTLDIPADLVSFWVSHLNRFRHRLPMLRSAVLDFHGGIQANNPLTMFEDAPNLSSLLLGDHDTKSGILIDHLPVENLRHVDICLSLSSLSRLPQLDSLRFRSPWVYRNDAQISSGLSKLDMNLDSSLGNVDFVDHLTLPSLTTLSLQCSTNFSLPALYPIASITSLISRSSCTLTNLTWKDIAIEYPQWISLLLAIPSLRRLTVSNLKTKLGDPLITEAFFQRLQSHYRFMSFLPELEYLDVETAATIRLEIFVKAMKSRYQPLGVAPLKSVRLGLAEQVIEDPGIFGPLDCLSFMGMQFVVQDSTGVVYLGIFDYWSK
ncbi:hypothetical protein C8J56DRAFT_17540 [Mycena floridula]|nr:hypothetical protein C8J56DRAFT_17540 [Mycena floridula]